MDELESLQAALRAARKLLTDLKNEQARLLARRTELEAELRATNERLQKLQPQYSQYNVGLIAKAQDACADAERYVADFSAPTVVWVGEPTGWLGEELTNWCVVKVTAKRIFVRPRGNRMCEQYLHDGTTPSSRYPVRMIDIAKTFPAGLPGKKKKAKQ